MCVNLCIHTWEYSRPASTAHPSRGNRRVKRGDDTSTTNEPSNRKRWRIRGGTFTDHCVGWLGVGVGGTKGLAMIGRHDSA